MKYLFVFLFVLNIKNIEAQIVAVGEAGAETINLNIQSQIPNTNIVAKEFVEIIYQDFLFYKETISATFNEQLKGSQSRQVLFKINDLSKKLSYELMNVKNEKILGGEVPLDKLNVRANAHFIANDIYRKLLGKESIFLSSIIFVSDRDSTKSETIKEVYKMDFDGFNKRRLTFHRGVVISPAVSSDGKKILYSLISREVKNRNINLYYMDTEIGKAELISSMPGLNSGAIFTPDNNQVVLTLSHEDNAEIYMMDLKTKGLKRLTRHFAPDVDPSINSKGDMMVFLSGRSLGPNIYRMNLALGEESTERISFVGQFNATPRFSPDGSEIAFSSWMDNRFDIYRISSDKTKLFRLTKDFGSNEDPTYSNDGQYIAFSSQKVLSKTKAVNNIYVMTREGVIVRQLTDDYGKCTTPRWTN